MRRMEFLDRGLIAVKTPDGVFLSWRFLGDEDEDDTFVIYKDGKILCETDKTNYLDKEGTIGNTYKVINKDKSKNYCKETKPLSEQYLRIPLDKPQGGVAGEGEFESEYEYFPGDCSVGDLDGDGEYEIVLMWNPTNAHDNAHNGFTGNVLLDAYKLDGTKLWRIDLGKNIRAGAHYTQLLVYDFNLDGKAEIIVKTADGTIDGKGNVIGDAALDHRSFDKATYGKILKGNEYLSAFRGDTGEVIDTIFYKPSREGNWGDNYGNRCDRFLACVAYLDGKRPSAVMCRGYYTRTTLAAYNLIDNKLQEVWYFDSDNGYKEYECRGNHNLSVGDVDDDGCDEIIYGACAFDHDGTPMYIAGCEFEGNFVRFAHGDAMHLGKFIPEREGLEVFSINEATHDEHGNKVPGYNIHDAKTGEVLWCGYTGKDTGRGICDNFIDGYDGAQIWVDGKLFDTKGNVIAQINEKFDNIWQITQEVYKDTLEGKANEVKGRFPNFAIYWDGDLLREFLDKIFIDKWDNEEKKFKNIFTAYGCTWINGTKGTPCLSADLFGDWREEVIYPEIDGTALRIYTTTIPTEYKIRTLMHDPQYRLAIAWQNVAYNQPPHPGFYLGPNYPLPKKRNDIDVSKINKGGKK